jgi:hypothetical protein
MVRGSLGNNDSILADEIVGSKLPVMGKSLGCVWLKCYEVLNDWRVLVMKVYLRHVKTRMYYSGWHNWTGDVKYAVSFERPEDAMQRARSEMINLLEMVIHEGEPVVERVVPIVSEG